jgi:uncharacterized protein
MSPRRTFDARAGGKAIPPAVGIALRPRDYDWVIGQAPAVSWFQADVDAATTVSTLARGLRKIARRYPLSLRVAGLSLTRASLPAEPRLDGISSLLRELQPGSVYCRLRWGDDDRANGEVWERSLRAVIRNIQFVQERLQRRLLIGTCGVAGTIESGMSGDEFLAEIVLRTGCGVRLDLEQLYRRALGASTAALGTLREYIDAVSAESIAQIRVIVEAPAAADTCPSAPQAAHARGLLEAAVAQLGPLPTLVQSDGNLTPMSILNAEAQRIGIILSQQHREPRHARLA